MMAAISGSAAADTAAIGALLIPMMREAGYNVPRSAGLIAAGGVIAPVIPPSIGFIMFGVIANVSIGKLFLAGIFPGLLMGVSLVIAWQWVARRDKVAVLPRQRWRRAAARRRRRHLGAADAAGHRRRAEVRHLHADRGRRRRLRLRLRRRRARSTASCRCAQLYALLVAAAKSTAVVVFLIAAALVSAWLITTSDVPAQVGAMLEPFMGNKTLLMLVIMVLVVIVGTALDFAPTVMILTPVLMPIDQAGRHRPGLLRRAVHHEQRHRPDHAAGGHRAQRDLRRRQDLDERADARACGPSCGPS